MTHFCYKDRTLKSFRKAIFRLQPAAVWGTGEIWQEMLTRANVLIMAAARVYVVRNSVLS